MGQRFGWSIGTSAWTGRTTSAESYYPLLLPYVLFPSYSPLSFTPAYGVMPPRRRPANFSSVSQAAAIIKQSSASMKDKAAALRYLAESGNYPDPTGPPPKVPPESPSP